MCERIYLLTGAAGLLGSNVSRKLIERGGASGALVLAGDPAAKYIPEKAEIVTGDVTDQDSLERFFTVPEGTEVYVIHSAGIVTLDPTPNEKVYAVNVTGTQNIINKCVSHKVKKLDYISSTGAIPERRGKLPIKKQNNLIPRAGPTSIYATYVAKNMYLNLINSAINYVYITTPYLIIDFELTNAILNAARRGVDIRIVTPHIPYKKLIF